MNSHSNGAPREHPIRIRIRARDISVVIEGGCAGAPPDPNPTCADAAARPTYTLLPPRS